MVDITDINKSLKVSIETVVKNAEIVTFVLDHLKTKNMCRNVVKKLSDLLRYVLD